MDQTTTSRWKAWWGRPGWDRFVHIAAAVTFVLAVGVFLELADDAPEGDYLPIESKIMQGLRDAGQPLGPAGTAAVIRDITAMGSAVVLIIMTLLVLGYLCMSGRLRVAALIAVATAGGQALNLILKHAFARERPDAALHLVEVTSTSFPSGHSMASSIFYLTIGALLARTAKRRREKSYFVGSAMLITFLIGVSRVYLGVHYPTDVLAGWSAGAAWAMVCWFFADWLGRRGKLREDTGEQRRV
ncbi:MAG: phosphatase PAP2 family protein [Opitutaceae bacterium]